MRLFSQRLFVLSFIFLSLAILLALPLHTKAASPARPANTQQATRNGVGDAPIPNQSPASWKRQVQTNTPPPNNASMIPRLVVQGAETPVQLKSLAIQTRIQDGFSETALDMTFFNPNRRILEGELQFPLLPGQEISGLALDINGEMRVGVPVNKARGQEVFEEITRQKVDPALLEATQGNAYKLRVYPIPANGTRRVIVRILQPLTPEKGLYHYRLPLAFAKTLSHFSLEVIVASPNGTPVISGNKLGLNLKPVGMLYQGKVEKTNMAPEGWLELSLPAPDSLANAVTATRWGENIYFSAAARVPLKTQARTLPKRATIVWDSSGSGHQRDHAREFDLLNRYFKAFGSGEVRLVLVRNQAEETRTFTIRQGDWHELKAALNAVVYDGGTDLASWKPSADCKEYLLFSDGLANFGNSLGERSLPAMNPGQRLFPITASLEANQAALRHAAGSYPVIDLLHNTPEQAAAKLLNEGVRVTIDPNSLAGKGQVTMAPQSHYLMGLSGKKKNEALVRFAGWIKDSSVSAPVVLTVQLAYPDGSKRTIKVTVPARDKIPLHQSDDSPLQARLWGRYAITELEGDAVRNKGAIARIGEKYGIVSRETSLIVLETAQDYARYKITPPAAMQAEVNTLRQRMGNAEEDKRIPDQQLQAIWQQKVDWWKTDFPLPEKKESATSQSHARPSAPTPSQESRSQQRSSSIAADAVERNEPVASMATPAMASQVAASPPREEAKAASPTGVNKPAGIKLSPWRSDAPYINRLQNAKDADLYAIYLDERPNYLQNSAFFIDVADRLFERGMPELGIRVLSNLAELQLENRQILRMLAYRLIQAKEYALAIPILTRVHELAPHEPQSLRDLALVMAAMGKTQEAVDRLYETATRRWHSRFGEVNTIALTEMNALIARSSTPINTGAMNKDLLTNLASDLRVVLSWDTDNTDMDLWVTDPTGEKASFSNKLTKQGGRMSADSTQGYGPEEFMLRNAKPGVYKVEAQYYGSSSQMIVGEVTLKVNLFTGFGTPHQKEEITTLRLKNRKTNVLVGEFTIGDIGK